MTPRKPLRLWPGVAAVVLQWPLWFGLPLVVPPDVALWGMLGGLACALVVLLWWLFFSRAPWAERLGAIVLMVVAVVATKRVVHESISNGMMGMMLPILSLPLLSLALVASAAAGRRLSDGSRRATMAMAILLACGTFALIRTGGITASADSDLHWRWTPTPEEILLARAGDAKEPVALRPDAAPAVAAAGEPASAPGDSRTPPADARTPEKSQADASGADASADWSGFRGAERDSIVRGVRIETDWSKSKPVELWRHAIGPGWSSFAVHGNLLYTQEQRGDDEIVASYNLSTGKPVWMHRDATRFWESNGGAGPRATPTLSNGRVYTFGATGILNALDARDGSVVWSKNAAVDTATKVPQWGFASSPLVVGNIVVVHTGPLVAYDRDTGERRWVSPERDGGYSSPHLVTIGGVAQILLMSGAGAASVAPADGTLLWEHAWPGTPIVQPALTADGDVLITAQDTGTRRLAVAHGSAGWTVAERWTSNGLKPMFNDFVVHKGHAYGFDGSILACIDLSDGARKWKGGRYGNGQLVLLSEQNVLLVVSEEGELALVSATPDKFRELARLPAIEGKTWNHPVLAGDVVLVRNGEEMAAFRLSLAGR